MAGEVMSDAIIKAAKEAKEGDRISLWTANAPEKTKNLSKDFLDPTDYGEGKRLSDALTQYRTKEYPAGNTDLKSAQTASDAYHNDTYQCRATTYV